LDKILRNDAVEIRRLSANIEDGYGREKNVRDIGDHKCSGSAGIGDNGMFVRSDDSDSDDCDGDSNTDATIISSSVLATNGIKKTKKLQQQGRSHNSNINDDINNASSDHDDYRNIHTSAAFNLLSTASASSNEDSTGDQSSSSLSASSSSASSAVAGEARAVLCACDSPWRQPIVGRWLVSTAEEVR
jgi:hypothetical protein